MSLPSVPGLVILLDPAPTNWLGEALQAGGHTVVTLADADGLAERLAEEDPDLVVIHADAVDDGLLRRCAVARDAWAGTIPVIVERTGPFSTAEQLAVLAAGAWECVHAGDPAEREGILLRLGRFVHAHRGGAQERLGMLTDPRTGLYNRLGLTRRAREVGALIFRTRDAVAGIVFAVQATPDAEAAMALCARALREEARVSDVVARLTEHEFAVLAPRTDAAGAIRVAERVARAVRARQAFGDAEGVRIELQAAYDTVTSLGYAPVQPLDLVISAAAALHARASEPPGPWLRRSGGHRSVEGISH